MMKVLYRSLWAAVVIALLAPQAGARTWPFGDVPTEEGRAATAVRVFHLAGAATETDNPWDLFGTDEAVVFGRLLERVEQEARDPAVKTLVFRFGSIGFGMAQMQELARAMQGVRDAGKTVIVHMESALGAVMIPATAADEVHLTPEGTIFLTGLRAEVSFYKDLLATVGIAADIESVGRFKSAPETMMRSRMSESAREQMNALLDSLYGSMVAAIAKHRGRSSDAIEAAIDVGLLGAAEAKKAGLVTHLTYWRDLLDRLEKRSGARPTLAYPQEADSPDLGSIFSIIDLLTRTESTAATGKKRVALIAAEGPIVMGRGSKEIFGNQQAIATEDILDALREADTDPLVKAIVLRINSPGGSALASDLIWRELARINGTKPVTVSMGNVAASGGYYIASAARRIFAESGTITGSIGVFGGKLTFGALMDKLDIHTEVFSRGKNAGMFSPLSRFSDSERAALRVNMKQTYDTFINRVAKGRNMTYDAVHAVAQGRVWSGVDARKVGLVDSLGGLGDALAHAAKHAKLGGSYDVVRFPQSRSVLEMLTEDPRRLSMPALGLEQLLSGLPAPLAAKVGGLAHALQMMLSQELTLALMPYEITIH